MDNDSLKILYNKLSLTDESEVIGKNLIAYSLYQNEKKQLKLTHKEWRYLIDNSKLEVKTKQGDLSFKLACLKIIADKKLGVPSFIPPQILKYWLKKIDFSNSRIKEKTDFLSVFELDESFDNVKKIILNKLPIDIIAQLCQSASTIVQDYMNKSGCITKFRDYDSIMSHFLSNSSPQAFKEVLEKINDRDTLIFVLQKTANFNLNGQTFFEQLWEKDKKCQYLVQLKNFLTGKWDVFIANQSSIILNRVLEENIENNVEIRNLIIYQMFKSKWERDYEEKLYLSQDNEKDIKESQSWLEKNKIKNLKKKEIINSYWLKNCSDKNFKKEMVDFKLELIKHFKSMEQIGLTKNLDKNLKNEELQNFYEAEKPWVHKISNLVNEFADKNLNYLMQPQNEQYFYTYLLEVAFMFNAPNSKKDFLFQRQLWPLERDLAIYVVCDPTLTMSNNLKNFYLPFLLNFQEMIRKDNISQEKFLLESSIKANAGELNLVNHEVNKKFKL